MARSTNAQRRPTRTAQAPTVREWSGPLIGREPEGADVYIARVTRLVADAQTHLYFDASFLMNPKKLGQWTRAKNMALAESRTRKPRTYAE